MNLELNFSHAHLKVLSAVLSNFVVVWLVAVFATRDPLSLTVNLIFATLSWYCAAKIEEALSVI